MTLHDTPTASEPTGTYGRARRLREATHSTHERLDAAIMAARPFESVQNYARFLKVQSGFHRDVAPLYQDPALQQLFPGLAGRSRFAAVAADLNDIGLALADDKTLPPAGEGMDLPEALGWLYVVEGSNLGAAFLFKAALKMGLSADHGARHLAEAPEGRAASWRRFKEALDAVALSKAEEARAIAGAEAAFHRVRSLVAAFLAPV
ncbi:biliverdin-producing heme oxygenase [Gemmobacter sp. 24YEA27]|uniref:biliverdin-producing heme oxygenase n=1 Tax=Gemmobacter sp. 24YEA27 TaxID=3040672 RepID=UPI0024B3972D|nr:biliverdin-producing heme oxygenase [Gemmobacter sp. 24YEA27]